MIFDKYVLFGFIFLLFSNIYSQPVGSTVWEKNGKKIFIFYDYHGIGLEDSGAFDYLYKNILNLESKRSRPLAILGEFPIYEPWFKFINGNQIYENEFLGRLGNLMGQQFRYNSISINTCEVREIIFNVYHYFIAKNFIAINLFQDDLLKKLYQKVKNITFGSLEDDIFNKIDCSDYSNDICLKMKESYNIFLEKIELDRNSNVVEIFESLNFEDITEFIHVLTRIFGSGLEARALHQTFSFKGDIALFIGAKHGFEIEKILKYNNFKLKKRWKKDQLDTLRVALESNELGQNVSFDKQALNWNNYKMALDWML